MTPHDPPEHSDVWAETVAAVGYLAATTRPDLTVWRALTEAVTEWSAALLDTDIGASTWEDADPLRTALERLLEMTAPAGTGESIGLDATLTAALAAWLDQTRDDVNDGYRFAVR